MGRPSHLESALGPDRAPCPDRRSQSQHRLGREASCARGRAPASGVLDFPRRPGGRDRAAEAPSGEVSFRRPVGEHLLRPPAARRGDDAGGAPEAVRGGRGRGGSHARLPQQIRGRLRERAERERDRQRLCRFADRNAAPHPDEVVAIEMLTIDELAGAVARRPAAYAFWLRHYLRHHRPALEQALRRVVAKAGSAAADRRTRHRAAAEESPLKRSAARPPERPARG